MFVLDTNAIAEIVGPAPDSAVAAWFEKRSAENLYLTAVPKAELLYGLAIMPAGKRRARLETAMARWLDRGFGERILPFDSAAARAYAEIAA